MRTKPMWDEAFELEADGTRDAPGFGAFSVLMPPGRYTVQLSVGGQTYSQPLEVRKDPNSFATEHDIRASTDRLLTLQNDQNAAADILNTIEVVRAQLLTLSKQLAADRRHAGLKVRGDTVVARFTALAMNLQDLRITGRGQDGVRWPVRLGGQIGYLAGNISASSFAPTVQQGAVHQLLQQRVQENRVALDRLLSMDLAAFNRLLRARGFKPVEQELPRLVP